jgi:hypothetical protein
MSDDRIGTLKLVDAAEGFRVLSIVRLSLRAEPTILWESVTRTKTVSRIGKGFRFSRFRLSTMMMDDNNNTW